MTLSDESVYFIQQGSKEPFISDVESGNLF